MKKNNMNFWINILIFIDFVLVVFTGIVLREFSVDLRGYTVLGVPRNELADLHWVLALSMILFIFAHLVLHWGWARVSFKRHLRIGPKSLAVGAIVLVLIAMIVAPVYLTKNLPDRHETKTAYQKQGPSTQIVASVEKDVESGPSPGFNKKTLDNNRNGTH
jgi:glucan phosphoethanolaminetransferase (alkaline phosphatase superfamily)